LKFLNSRNQKKERAAAAAIAATAERRRIEEAKMREIPPQAPVMYTHEDPVARPDSTVRYLADA